MRSIVLWEFAESGIPVCQHPPGYRRLAPCGGGRRPPRHRLLRSSPNGVIAGAILFGYPLEAPGVAAAMKAKRDLSGQLDALRAGDWSVFVEQPGDVPSEAAA